MQKTVRQPDVPYREPYDVPDPPRMTDPVSDVMRILQALAILNALNLAATLSLWFK